jgi:hypothetical protein
MPSNLLHRAPAGTMKRRIVLCRFLRETAGHSLVEVVVATSLVMTVLVPLSGMVVFLLNSRQNAGHLVALALAEEFMEETLHERSYVSRHVTLDRDRWLVQKSVSQTGNQVTIVIRVFRRHRPRPLAELMTVRLLS